MKPRQMMNTGALLLSLWLLLTITGCSAMRTASSSGDQSTVTKGSGGSESIKEDQLASVESPSATAPSSQGGTNSGNPVQPFIAPGKGTTSIGRGGIARTDSSTRSYDQANLGDIYFDFDRYAIRKDAMSILEGDGNWLREKPGQSVMIEGHCDERGTSAYNLVLGEKRAKAAKHYLEDLGIPASRLQITSYGKERPFCKDHNDACWQQNRRAHFVVQ